MAKKFTFAGHDTFVLRHGWLKKISDRLEDQSSNSPKSNLGSGDPAQELFEPESAMSAFGVGKNMVHSMRYWAIASNFFEYADGSAFRMSDLGALVLGQNSSIGTGLDPFLEQLSSLWLLHWEIATNEQHCSAWYFAFSSFNKTIFTKEALLSALVTHANENGWKISSSSIEKDVDCILQMYCPDTRNSKGQYREEGLESPLAELGLILADATSGGYRFEIGPKPSLDPRVLYYAIAKYASGKNSRLLSLDEIFYGPGAPGRVFKLDEGTMCSMLEEASKITDGLLEWQETGPLRQLKLSEDLRDPVSLLKNLYQHDEMKAA